MPTEIRLATLSSPERAASQPASSFENQYLIFGLGEVLYALPARSVREIHWLPELSPLDEAAPAIVGLLNLRGHVLPVIDLSERLGHVAMPYRLEDSVVIVQHGEDWAGVIVGQVHGVVGIAAGAIEPVPQLGRTAGATGSLISKLAKVSGDVVMLLDVESLLRGSVETGTQASQHELPDDNAVSTGSARIFAPQATPDERTVFRDRALRLRTVMEEEDRRGLFPMALVILNGEHFGVSLNQVREFCGLRHVTPVPCTPGHILGQMNLRGDVVTLVDIQPLLNLPPRSSIQDAKVLVTQHEDAPVGILLDDVLDVLYKHPEEVAPLHASNRASTNQYYSGGVFHDGRMVCLLHLPKMLTDSSLVVDEAP